MSDSAFFCVQQPLSYIQGLQERSPESIELIVIHATETPDLALARQLAEEVRYAGSGTGNSGHYYIDLDGSCYQYVPVQRVAHHVVGHNQHSVGIELVNRGRYPDWFHSQQQNWHTPYPQAQLDSLLALVRQLRQELPQIRYLARHSDLDQNFISASDDANLQVPRKLDPGQSFPWTWLLEHSQLPSYVHKDTAVSILEDQSK